MKIIAARPLIFCALILANLVFASAEYSEISCAKPLLAEAQYYMYSPIDQVLVPPLIAQTGGPLLDLGSGSGRVLHMAYSQGIRAMGIEEDTYLADFSMKKMPGVTVIVGDYTEIELPENVGLYTSLSNSWSLVTDRRSRRSTLQAIYRSLRPGGRFILSLATDLAVGNEIITASLPEPNLPISLRLDYREFPRRSMRRYDLNLSQGKLEERHSFPSRMISQRQMREDIERAKFKILHTYGGKEIDRHLSPLTDDSERQIYILGKD